MKTLIILLLLTSPSITFAATTVRPSLDSLTGNYFKGSSGVWTNNKINAPATITTSGRTIGLTARMSPAVTAGKFMKLAARANPYLLAGTTMLQFLATQNVTYNETSDQWEKEGEALPNTDVNAWEFPENGYTDGVDWGSCAYMSAPCHFLCRVDGIWNYVDCIGPASSEPIILDEEDWDDITVIPDPTMTDVGDDTVPTAPYLPEGLPVEPPEYDPQDVPTGDPYTRPDGSTWQPYATISPNPTMPGTVTIDEYDKPITTPTGDPVDPTTPNEDTTEDVDFCIKNPDVLACLDVGEPEDLPVLPVEELQISYNPIAFSGTGSCPPDQTTSFLGQNVVISWYWPCQMAILFRPFLIALAWLAGAYIFISGTRT